MNTRIVVLAAGRGTRMNSDIPKVLIPLGGKPILRHLMDAIAASGIDSHPVIVVGENENLIREALGPDGYTYIRQDAPLGTGHAVLCTEAYLAADSGDIIVLYGDHPFVSAETIKNLHALHKDKKCAMSMMTVTVEDFEAWRAPFYDFGRVVRDKRGDVRAIVEVKDATAEEREIQELNPSFFCFRASWLWPHLKRLTNNNSKREYYLTDLVRIAIDEGECIASMDINPLQAIGVNTPEHLEIAKAILQRSFPTENPNT